MSAFGYRGDALYCEDVAVADIVAKHGSPVYIYSLDEIQRRYESYATAFPDALVCYAYKANASLALCAWLRTLGAGADVVSGGELRVAQAAGVPGDMIVFNGNGKSDAELALALEAGVLSINADAVEELERIAAIAKRVGRPAPVTIRINPGVDPHTHRHIATGVSSSQFGVALTEAEAAYEQLARYPALTAIGVHSHIGSQITQSGPFVEAVERIADLARRLMARGFPLQLLDIGGGLGIDYRRWEEADPHPLAPSPKIGEGEAVDDVRLPFSPGGGRGWGMGEMADPHPLAPSPIIGEGEAVDDVRLPFSPGGGRGRGMGEMADPHPLAPSPKIGEGGAVGPLTPAELAQVVLPRVADLGLRVVMEPGRSLVAAAGILVGQVLHVKSGADTQRVVLDTGMNALIRPSLYEAYHAILPLEAREASMMADVVGPNCESSDVVGRDRALPRFKSGDLVAVMDAGAYGYALASNYNSRPRPAEVAVRGRRWWTIRPAETWEGLLAGQVIPSF